MEWAASGTIITIRAEPAPGSPAYKRPRSSIGPDRRSVGRTQRATSVYHRRHRLSGLLAAGKFHLGQSRTRPRCFRCGVDKARSSFQKSLSVSGQSPVRRTFRRGCPIVRFSERALLTCYSCTHGSANKGSRRQASSKVRHDGQRHRTRTGVCSPEWRTKITADEFRCRLWETTSRADAHS